MNFHNSTLLFSFLCAVAGCSAEIDYEYISMAESMSIVDSEVPTVSGVHDNFAIPVAYNLERERYIVYAETDASANRPNIFLSVEGKNNNAIDFEVVEIQCGLYELEILPVQYEIHGYRPNSVQLLWASGRRLPPCDTVSLPSEEDRIVRLSVFDSEGKIAEEELAFDVVLYGKRTVYDTL